LDDEWQLGRIQRSVGSGCAGTNSRNTRFVRHAFKSVELSLRPWSIIGLRSSVAAIRFRRLASLCARCHNAKSRAEQAGEDYLIKGCDVFGNPLDPKHPWYRERL
jgi:hypothetical protein